MPSASDKKSAAPVPAAAKKPPEPLPTWAEELKKRYVRGEASQFILYGNVDDLVLHDDKLMMIDEFLCNVMLGGNKDTIALYNTSTGVRFSKRKDKLAGVDELLLSRTREKVFPVLERMLMTEDR